MSKLKKKDFDKKYRFRESRNESVSCVTCNHRTGGTNNKEGPAFCEHTKRVRKIKIAEYWEGFFGAKGTSHNIASKRVCDTYTSKPLPEGVEKIILPKKHAILLGTQYRDQYHADLYCPYVIEELRMQKEGSNKRADVSIADLSEMVPGEVIRAICEMPCCESKLPFQISMFDAYRQRTGIKPDGSEPKRWVRNGIVEHEKKAVMSPKELESVFDLERFNPGLGDIHDKIIAASDYLHKNCNRLGSRPLSEAVNPVCFSSHHHILKESLEDLNGKAHFWAYDERLFDSEKGLKKPIKDLERIPEGLILCMDTKRIFRSAQFHCRDLSSERFYIYGILKSLDNENLLSKGATHFIEIGAINYHDRNHMWGVFGKDFEGLASFHEQ